jgi:methionine aminopeptidase
MLHPESVRGLDRIAEEFIRDHVQCRVFLIITLSHSLHFGIRTEVHGIPSDKVFLKEGDIISMTVVLISTVFMAILLIPSVLEK